MNLYTPQPHELVNKPIWGFYCFPCGNKFCS